MIVITFKPGGGGGSCSRVRLNARRHRQTDGQTDSQVKKEGYVTCAGKSRARRGAAVYRLRAAQCAALKVTMLGGDVNPAGDL